MATHHPSNYKKNQSCVFFINFINIILAEVILKLDNSYLSHIVDLVMLLCVYFINFHTSWKSVGKSVEIKTTESRQEMCV